MCSRYSSLSSQSLCQLMCSRYSSSPLNLSLDSLLLPKSHRSLDLNPWHRPKAPMAAAMTVLFKFGDLVWARVGSRYWPGHIFHPSLASKSDRDRQIPNNGRLVSFSDVSYGWYRLNQRLPFERYFERMLRQATRDPDLLEKTLREALNEVWRWAALGRAGPHWPWSH